MFLRRLKLENVRSIPSLDLDFSDGDAVRQWTLLLGSNGTGKSTILRSIALLLAGSDALPDLIGRPGRWVRYGTDQAKLTAEIVTKAGERRDVGLTLRPDQSMRDVFDENDESLGELDAALEHTARSYLVVGYGVSRRPSSKTAAIEPSQRLRSAAVATLFDPDARLQPIENWAIDLDYRQESDGLDAVREALAHLLPDVRFDHIDRDDKSLVFTTVDGKIPFDQLSDGLQAMASWLGDLLFRVTETFQDYRRPLSARGLLLIDELELHLHPTWQRRLIASIRAALPNFQVVATTHSPMTAHQAGAGELFALKRERVSDEEGEVSRLTHYPVAPQSLLVSQLIASPMFEIGTLQSRAIELARERYLELRDKPERDPAEERTFAQLQRTLANIPKTYR